MVNSQYFKYFSLLPVHSPLNDYYFLQEKSDSSDGGKESSSEAGPDGQDGSSSSSSKTKESSAGYEEKVVSTLQATLFKLLFRLI